jgi:hypothetical protein
MNEAAIDAARTAAAQYLRQEGYGREADIVASGEGDDFREVRIAAALWNILNATKPSAPATTRLGRRIAGEEC